MGEWRHGSVILYLGTRWKVSGQLHVPPALPSVPIRQEAGWATEPVWKLQKREKSCLCQEANPILLKLTLRFIPQSSRHHFITVKTETKLVFLRRVTVVG
jgi:hypothetical protein